MTEHGMLWGVTAGPLYTNDRDWDLHTTVTLDHWVLKELE